MPFLLMCSPRAPLVRFMFVELQRVRGSTLALGWQLPDPSELFAAQEHCRGLRLHGPASRRR